MPGIPIKHMPHRKTFLIVEEEKLSCCPEHYYEVTLVLWPVFLLNDYVLLTLYKYVGASLQRSFTRLSISWSQHVTL